MEHAPGPRGVLAAGLLATSLALTPLLAARADSIRSGQEGAVCSTPVVRVAVRSQSVSAPSVGITYFAGRSRSGDDAHLAAALTRELATQLLSGRIQSGSAPGQDGRPITVRLSEGGEFADVDVAVTGAVFREGDLLRTTVRLTRTIDGLTLWSGTRVRPVLELPMLARLVAQEVAIRIGARLTAPTPARVSQKSAEVYELVLRGMYPRSRYDPDELSESIESFDEALQKDPNAPGVSEMRDQAQLRLLAWGGRGDELEARLLATDALRHVTERARDEAERLIEEADGEIRDGKLAHACQLLNVAIESDSRASPAYALRALVRAHGGDMREAFSDAETVTQLGRPRWGNALRALVTNRVGDTTSARRQARVIINGFRRVRGRLPFWDARFTALALTETGFTAEAQAILSRIDPRDPRIARLRRDPLLRPAERESRRPRRAG